MNKKLLFSIILLNSYMINPIGYYKPNKDFILKQWARAYGKKEFYSVALTMPEIRTIGVQQPIWVKRVN